MIQKWNIQDVAGRIDEYVGSKEQAMVEAIFGECVSFAKEAKSSHTYRNYKGELESSVGVVVLKDLNEVKEWRMLSSAGTDPIRGLNDLESVINEIVGKSTLPNGMQLPSIGISGIVFAAAPYAGEVEGNGRKVLNDFSPDSSMILEVLKVAIGK